MSIGRFYKPSESQYVSQFVPERIPAELMMGVLANKQKTYDDTAAKIQSLADWNINALPEMDTQVRDEYKKDIRAFIDDSMDKDLSSPEYARKYLAKLRDIRDNKDLAAITANYNKHQEFIKRYEELRKSNDTYAYAEELMNEYLQRYNEYTKPVNEGGLGFKGDIQLGDENILSGVNIHKEGEQYFDELKANGAESLAFLEEGLAYKNDWEGISGNRIEGRTKEVLNNWVNSRAGQQLSAKYDMQHLKGIPSVELAKMTPEQRAKYDQDKFTYIGNALLDIGKGFAWNKTSTNADVAYRERWNLGNERELLFPQQPVINVAGNTENIQRDFNTDLLARSDRDKQLAQINWVLDNYERAKQNPNTPQLQHLASLPPSTISYLRDQKYALELQNRDHDLKQANAIKQAYTANDKNINPKYVDEYGEYKIKLNPYEFTKSGNNVNELIAINDKFDLLYKQAKDNLSSDYKIIGITSGDPKFVYNSVTELKQIYDRGLNVINRLKATPNLTENEKLQLEAYEQKFRINSTNIFRRIPESYTQQADGTYLKGMETFNNAVKSHYNDSDTWVPNNQLRSDDKVILYNSTQDKMGKPATSADYMMEQYLSKAPMDNIIMLGNEVIKPDDPRYPMANSKAKIISSRVDKINGVDTPVFDVSYQYAEPTKIPHYDTDGNVDYYKDATKTSTKQYTVIAKGVAAQNYNQTKAKENISIYMADPNSPTAKTALINGIKFKYPYLSSGLTELYNLGNGEDTVVDISIAGNTNDKLIWKVQKKTDYGDYSVKIIDPDDGSFYYKKYGTQHELTNDYLKYNGIDLNQILNQ